MKTSLGAYGPPMAPTDPDGPTMDPMAPGGPRRTPDGPRRPFASKMKKIAIWFIFILISSNFDLKHFVLLVLRLYIYYIIQWNTFTCNRGTT